MRGHPKLPVDVGYRVHEAARCRDGMCNLIAGRPKVGTSRPALARFGAPARRRPEWCCFREAFRPIVRAGLRHTVAQIARTHFLCVGKTEAKSNGCENFARDRSVQATKPHRPEPESSLNLMDHPQAAPYCYTNCTSPLLFGQKKHHVIMGLNDFRLISTRAGACTGAAIEKRWYRPRVCGSPYLSAFNDD